MTRPNPTGACDACGGPVTFIWGKWCHTDSKDWGNHQGTAPKEQS